MAEHELEEHARREYERATGIHHSARPADALVTELADYLIRAQERMVDAAALGILHLLRDGLDGTLTGTDRVLEAAEQSIRELEQSGDEGRTR